MGEERLSRATFGQVCAGTFTPPPAPFQQNAIKDGPGRGRGRLNTGNRIVTLSLQVFPLLEEGNAVRFLLVVFLCLVRCLLSFFAVLLFLGSLFRIVTR